MTTSSPTEADARNPRDFSASEIVYDEERFKELVLYVAEKAATDPSFGDTKLNKVLFFSDFFAYGFLGKPITGAEYQKLPFGPAPRKILPARRALVNEGRADVVNKGRSFKQTVTVARTPANRRLFDTAQLDLVDEVFDMLREDTAISASEFSHQASAGWQLVEMHETIPYETVFVSTLKPPREAFDRGRELAAQHNW